MELFWLISRKRTLVNFSFLTASWGFRGAPGATRTKLGKQVEGAGGKWSGLDTMK